MSEGFARAIEALAAQLAPRLAEPAREWLAAARRDVERDLARLVRHFAAAGRRIGRAPLLDPPVASALRLEAPDGPILNPWTTDEAARACLLLEAALAAPESCSRLLGELYEHGSAGERTGVLRALQFFPENVAGTGAVRDALRANAVDLFAAAICENLYASRHLDDATFFQAVLKCAFVGLRLDRVERVTERTTAELARMLYAYVTEREQAGRPVAPELWALVAIDPPAAARGRIEVARARGLR